MKLRIDACDPYNFYSYEKWLTECRRKGLCYSRHFLFFTCFREFGKKNDDAEICVVPDSWVRRRNREAVFYEDYETKLGKIENFDVIQVERSSLKKNYRILFQDFVQTHSILWYVFICSRCCGGIFFSIFAACFIAFLANAVTGLSTVFTAWLAVSIILPEIKNYIGWKKGLWPPIWISRILNSFLLITILVGIILPPFAYIQATTQGKLF